MHGFFSIFLGAFQAKASEAYPSKASEAFEGYTSEALPIILFSMTDKMISKKNVLLLTSNDDTIIHEEISKDVVVESKLTLILNGREFVSLLCMKAELEELALGFLFNEGIINSLDDIEETVVNNNQDTIYMKLKEDIDIDQLKEVDSITSGCGKGRTFVNEHTSKFFKTNDSDAIFTIQDIWNQVREFNLRPSIHKTVGGTHSCLLIGEGVTIFNEDIGRHNCIDKIAGILLKSNQINSASNGILIASGRISSEMMTKIIRLNIPIVASVSSPTTAAIDLAEKYNVTLLGYVRGKKANVYSGKDRITYQL
jgi:FdhD protein